MTDRENIAMAAEVVKQGGVIAYPTESCFGLGCAPNCDDSIERIRVLKRRSVEQGFILVADSLSRLKPYINWYGLNREQRDIIERSWPGPVSWLIPASGRTGRNLRGNNDTLAVRVSAFGQVRELCFLAQTALVSTSANRRSAASLTTSAAVIREFGDEIDYVLDLPIQGQDKPSQIIDSRTQHIIR